MRSKPTVPPRPDAEDIFAGGGEMGALMRSFDWSSTPLGPVQLWPEALCTAVSILLASRFPMLIYWGPELIRFYNDAIIPSLAGKHPAALGRRGHESLQEVWHIVGPMLKGVLASGRATWSENQPLIWDRNGYPEECFFTYSLSPIRANGSVGGVFVTSSETTALVLGGRRLATLRELATRGAEARSAEEVCRIAVATFSRNNADIPFALLYLLDPEGRQASLEGATGLSEETVGCPSHVDLGDEMDQESDWPLAGVVRGGVPELVSRIDERFGPGLALSGDVPSHSALVLPVPRPGEDRLAGLLVAGISDRRALDDDYRGFLQLVAVQVGAAIANARAHEEERRRAEALAEIDRAKTEFFSNVSHEFRTPLTLLLAPVEDALADARHPLPAAQKARLEVVRRNGLRLLKLVNTLLDFSRIEAGRVEAVYQPTELGAVTADLAGMFRSAMERAGLRYVVNCPPSGEPFYVDRDMWEKIVLNLLSNALKFTFAGEVAVTLRCGESGAELEVRDTGIGIASEEMPYLFERFHRVRAPVARTQEGTGIGLALVKALAQMHGGTVRVASQPGGGTTFVVSIPRGRSHLPQTRVLSRNDLPSTALDIAPFVEEAQRWLPEPNPQKNERTDRTGRGRRAARGSARDLSRILLADDNADMRDYLTRLLSERYRVEAVADGASALAAIRRCIPHLVLADVMMPGLDGFALLRELRADPRTRSVPVILLSARAGEEATVDGMQSGADDYLVKPFSARELIARIAAHLEMARLRQAAARREAALRAEVDRERRRAGAREIDAEHLRTLAADVVEDRRENWERLVLRLRETLEREITAIHRTLASRSTPPAPDPIGPIARRIETALRSVRRLAAELDPRTLSDAPPGAVPRGRRTVTSRRSRASVPR